MKNINHNNLLKRNILFNIHSLGINKKTIKDLYFFMKKLRLIEDSMSKEYHPADEMRCPVHFCTGQEVIPSVLNQLIDKDDYLFSHHRSHGYYLAKKSPAEKLFAEIYGKKTGANSGLAGSQDISYPRKNFFGGAILAGSIAIAVGSAMSLSMEKNNKKIVVTGFGEAATDEGIFWESLNYSSLNKLPIMFICENNNYSVFSPQAKRQGGMSLSDKAKSFGIKSKKIFGNDIFLAYKEIKKAFKYIKNGQGPFFLETFTYRFNGHVGPLSDDLNGYRSQKEISFWKKNCPIKLIEDFLLKKKIMTSKEISSLEKKINLEISNYFKFARSSKFPDIQTFKHLNYSSKTPKADNLLKEMEKPEFDENQKTLEIKGY